MLPGSSADVLRGLLETATQMGLWKCSRIVPDSASMTACSSVMELRCSSGGRGFGDAFGGIEAVGHRTVTFGFVSVEELLLG